MPEFRYAKGRIMESPAFITKEMDEFESEYKLKTWEEYSSDNKLQKLSCQSFNKIRNIPTIVVDLRKITFKNKKIKKTASGFLEDG